MVKRLLSVRRLVAVFGFAVALLGWVAAFVTVRGTSDLEDRLASAEAELSETRSALVQTSGELAAFRLEYREYQDISANLEEVTGNLAGAKAELADLLLQIDAAEARLDQQRAEAGEQQTSLTDTTRDSVTTTEGNVEAQPTTAPEQLAAAIIAKPSDAEIDAALAELDLAAFVPAGINAGDPPNWRRNAVATPDGPSGPVTGSAGALDRVSGRRADLTLQAENLHEEDDEKDQGRRCRKVVHTRDDCQCTAYSVPQSHAATAVADVCSSLCGEIALVGFRNPQKDEEVPDDAE